MQKVQLKTEGNDLVPYVDGKLIEYVTSVNIESNCGDIPIINIKCVALHQRLSLEDLPIYQVLINADLTKIDKDKLIKLSENVFINDTSKEQNNS